MTRRRIRRRAPLIQAMAWAVLVLLTAGYLRVLVVCSGPCCDPHVELAFAGKSCCEELASGGCCERVPAPRTPDAVERHAAQPARRSCCGGMTAEAAVASDCAGEDERNEPSPSDPAGSCCMSAPVDFEIGPLPGTLEWKRATELVALAPIAAGRPSTPLWNGAERRQVRFSGAEDPPPLAHLRALVTTTLLRI